MRSWEDVDARNLQASTLEGEAGCVISELESVRYVNDTKVNSLSVKTYRMMDLNLIVVLSV